MAINRDKVEAAAIKLLQQGKYDKAIVEFKKLVDDDKTDVRNLLKLGETYVKVGAKKESIEAYERAAAIYTEQGFYLKAVAVFKQILRVDPNVPELHLKLAELYQQLGLTSDSLASYQTVAMHYENQGRVRDALDMLKRMVDLDPDNIASRIKLGELFAKEGLAQEAVQEMRSALDFLKQQQRFDDYVRVGEKLVQYDPSALDVCKELAKIYMTRAQQSVALGKLQMCFKADPRDVEVLSMIAQAFLDMQQVPKTISVYKEMARIYVADGEVDLATRTWERVLELAPGDIDAEGALGRSQQAVTSPAFPNSSPSGRPAATLPGGATTAAAGGGAKPGGRPVVPTVVAPAQAGSPMSAPSSQMRPNPEDEQLQRLLTETDVYVKYGLKEKAIDHIQKVFAVRPDFIPALEKLKILQQQLGGPGLADTLKRLVMAAEAQGHLRVEEWRTELDRAQRVRPSTSPSFIVPASQSQSSEGEFIDDPSHADGDPVELSPVTNLPPLPATPRSFGSGSVAVPTLSPPTLAAPTPLSPPAPLKSPAASSPSRASPSSSSSASAAKSAPMPQSIRAAPPPVMPPDINDEPFGAESSSGVIKLDDNASGIISLDPSSVDESFLDGAGSMMDDLSGNLALPPDEPDDDANITAPTSPASFNPPTNGGGTVPRAIPRMPTGVMKAPAIAAPPSDPRTEPARPSAVRDAFARPSAGPGMDDVVDLNDADALVRRALQDISAEDVVAAADELLLEASPDDILSGEGGIVDDDSFEPAASRSPMASAIASATAPQSHGTGQVSPTASTKHNIPLTSNSGPDEDEIDRLAREAVADANASLAADILKPDVAVTAVVGLSAAELDEIREFDGDTGGGFASSGGFSSSGSAPAAHALSSSSSGGFAVSSKSSSVVPPEMRDDAFGESLGEGFDNPTLALKPEDNSRESDLATDERPRRASDASAARPTTQPSLMARGSSSADDLDAAALSSTLSSTKAPAPKHASAAPPPAVTGDISEEFDPSSFDLPADVKELLRAGGGKATAALDELDSFDLDAEIAKTTAAVTAFKPGPSGPVPAEMRSHDSGFAEPSGEVTLQGKLGLASKAQGFEDDQANQFFPDELEEAEFFIQQELLDEAKDILTAILEDVPESARVQWMLQRITAKEAGEPEPPAPWEQRILEEVQAQLEDLGMTEQRPAAGQGLSDASEQVSVEEVLSQFKKGVAETVPEDDAATHYELGIAYREMGLHDDAISEFQIAARNATRSADARFVIGLVRMEQGDLDKALKSFEDALSVPSASKDQRGAAEYQRGVVLDQLGRQVEAVRAFKGAKAFGNGAPDLNRRIKLLIDKVGDVDAGGGGASHAGMNGSNGANGHSKGDAAKPAPPGRGPKNIDYL